MNKEKRRNESQWSPLNLSSGEEFSSIKLILKEDIPDELNISEEISLNTISNDEAKVFKSPQAPSKFPFPFSERTNGKSEKRNIKYSVTIDDKNSARNLQYLTKRKNNAQNIPIKKRCIIPQPSSNGNLIYQRKFNHYFINNDVMSEIENTPKSIKQSSTKCPKKECISFQNKYSMQRENYSFTNNYLKRKIWKNKCIGNSKDLKIIQAKSNSEFIKNYEKTIIKKNGNLIYRSSNNEKKITKKQSDEFYERNMKMLQKIKAKIGQAKLLIEFQQKKIQDSKNIDKKYQGKNIVPSCHYDNLILNFTKFEKEHKLIKNTTSHRFVSFNNNQIVKTEAEYRKEFTEVRSDNDKMQLSSKPLKEYVPPFKYLAGKNKFMENYMNERNYQLMNKSQLKNFGKNKFCESFDLVNKNIKNRSFTELYCRSSNTNIKKYAVLNAPKRSIQNFNTQRLCLQTLKFAKNLNVQKQ